MSSKIQRLCYSMVKCTRIGTTTLFLTALFGCASTEPATERFYTLQPLESNDNSLRGSVGIEEAELLFNPVSVPSYLAQNGIVTAGIDGKIEWANYHLWAELPAVAIKRNLERCVLRSTRSGIQQQRINVEIHRFQGDGNGGVVFDGTWSSHKVADNTALGTYLFEYRQPQIGDGYGALTTALSKTVEQLCVDILSKTLKAQPVKAES